MKRSSSNTKACSLQEYLARFARENTSSDGQELLLRVSSEEAQHLGLFFIRGFVGWLQSQTVVERKAKLSERRIIKE